MTTTTKTMTTAAKIRAALKSELGLNSRKVSVRDEGGSTSTSVLVRVKTSTVSLSDVTAVAGRFQKIDRCEMSGEILGGGNTFVSVEYTPEAKVEGAAAYLDAVAAAMTAAKIEGEASSRNESSLHPITGTDLTLQYSRMDWNIWSDTHERAIWGGCNAADVAGQVFLVLERRAA